MFEKTEIRRSRERLEVSIRLANGDAVDGDLFLIAGERLTDLLNDDRAFLPVDTGRETVVIAKSQVAEVRAIEPVVEDHGEDPYVTLRVEPSASDKELRAAWMARVKSCHPDRLAALDLDPEIVQAARKVSQRINAAYDQVIRERKAGRAA